MFLTGTGAGQENQSGQRMVSVRQISPFARKRQGVRPLVASGDPTSPGALSSVGFLAGAGGKAAA